MLESPWPALVIGLVVETLLAIALLRSGRGALLWAMLAVAVVVAAAVAVERLVPTERKQIAATIDGAAAAVEANDLQALQRFVAPTNVQLQNEAQRYMGEIKFAKVKVRNLDIVINRLTSPPSAKATFNVFVTGTYRAGEFGEQSRPAKVILSLDRIGGRWLISAYEVKLDPRDL